MIHRRPPTWWNPLGLGPVNLRLLIIFLYTTAAMVLMFTVLSASQNRNNARNLRFERQIAANCQLTNDGNRAFNAVLDQQVRNVQRSTALKPAQKKQAIETYGRLHLPVTDCPPR